MGRFGVASGLGWWLEVDPLARFAWDSQGWVSGLVATVLSCVTTFVAGVVMFEMLNLLRPHLR